MGRLCTRAPAADARRSSSSSLAISSSSRGSDHFRRHPVLAGVVVHLAQVGLEPNRQDLGNVSAVWQLPRLPGGSFIQEPGYIRPTAQGLFQLDLIRARVSNRRNSSRVRAFWPMGCECRKVAKTACSDFAIAQRRQTGAEFPGPFPVALQDRRPFLAFAFVFLGGGDVVNSRAASPISALPGVAQENIGRHQRALSQFSASRRARAKVRRTPRVRWNPSRLVHLE